MTQQPQPKKGEAYTVVFPILDNDGDLVSGAAGLDSEISKDLGAFQNCVNEAVEIASSSGMYYLALTAAEMTADIIAIIVKTSTTDAKTTPIVLYPGLKNINDDVAATLSAAERNGVADAVLSRPISNVEGSAVFRSLVGAVAKLVNKVAVAGTTLTVYRTNDTTPMGSQEITTDEDAKPIVGVDTE